MSDMTAQKVAGPTPAAEFWAEILANDIKSRNERRSMVAITRDAGIAYRTAERWLYNMVLPPRITDAFNLARVTGMDRTRVVELYEAAADKGRYLNVPLAMTG